MRTRFHHGDRHIFADGARNHDERKIQAGLVQGCQCGRSVEPRQMIVGNDRVPSLAGESGAHRGCVLYPLRPYVVPGLFQKADDQPGIALGILDL